MYIPYFPLPGEEVEPYKGCYFVFSACSSVSALHKISPRKSGQPENFYRLLVGKIFKGGIFMQKQFVILLAAVSLWMVFSTGASSETQVSTGKYIQIMKPNTKVYENGQTIGYLREGEIFQYQWEEQQQYAIQYENYVAYVNRSNVRVTTTVPLEVVPKSASTQDIRTRKATNLLDKYGRTIVTASADRRFPVYGTTDTQYKVLVGNRVLYVDKTAVQVDKGIPILMYHHILRDAENTNYRNVSTTISDRQFISQMDYLKSRGYETISMADLEQYVKGTRLLSAKTVAITFDDGLKSNVLYAYPKLKELGYRATMFHITSRMLDTPQMFDPARLQFISKPEVDATRDVFDYHGHTHAKHNILEGNISELLVISHMELKDDFYQAQQLLPQQYFAYPFGQYDSVTIQVLQEMGYKAAVTSKTGYVSRNSNVYELPRIGIRPTTTITKFASYFQ